MLGTLSRVIRGALCADTLDAAGCNADVADAADYDDCLKLSPDISRSARSMNLWKLAKLARRVAFSERKNFLDQLRATREISKFHLRQVRRIRETLIS